jgi:hypothetical protein
MADKNDIVPNDGCLNFVDENDEGPACWIRS